MIRTIVRFKNDAIQRAIEEKYGTVAAFARQHHENFGWAVHTLMQNLGELINFRPRSSWTEIRVDLLASFLDIDPADILVPDDLATKLSAGMQFVTRPVALEAAGRYSPQRLIAASPEEALELREAIHQSMAALTPREQAMLRAKAAGMTDVEIGKQWGVGGTRVGQILQAASRKAAKHIRRYSIDMPDSIRIPDQA